MSVWCGTRATLLSAAGVAMGAAVWLGVASAASSEPPTLAASSTARGMVCDGVSDDSAAFQRLLESGPAAIHLPPGVCRLASPCALVRDIELVGHATTLLVDSAGVGMVASGVRVVLRDLIIDGADKASGLLFLSDGEFEIDNVEFRNVFDRTSGGAKAVACADCARGVVRNSVFESIRALANGVEGDAGGAVRAIYLAGAPQSVDITGSRFTTVHSVDASGNPVMEDADAIHVSAIGRDVRVRVDGNMFVDVGKRAIKFQCDGAAANGNVVRSAWRDGAGMMFAALQLAGSRLVASGNSIAGPLQHGIELGDAEALPGGKPAAGNLVAGNTFHGGTDRDAGPYGLRSGVVAERQHDLTIVGNAIHGFRNGVLVRGGSRVSVLANSATGATYCVASEPTVRGAAEMTRGLLLADNRCVGRSPARAGVGAFFADGAENIAIRENLFRAFTDGVNVRGRPSSCEVSGNAFDRVHRHSLKADARACSSGERPDAPEAPICSRSRVGTIWRFADRARPHPRVRVCVEDARGGHAWKSLAEIRPGSSVGAEAQP